MAAGLTRLVGRAAAARPVLTLLVWYGLGAALGCQIGPLGARAWALLMGSSAAIVALAAGRERWPSVGAERTARVGLAFAALALGVVGIGLERVAYERTPLRAFALAQDESEVLRLEGTLAADPDESFERWVLLLDVDSVEYRGARHALEGRARLFVGGEAERPSLSEGDRVAAWARVAAPRGRANPGGFDGEAHAFRRGIHALAFCKSPALLSRTGRARVGWVRDVVSRLRRSARQALAAWVRPGPAAGIVRAMVLGDRAGLAPETEEAFRIAGTYHVLALSGAQVALVVGLLLWPLRRLGAPRALAVTVVGAGVVSYALFVGGEIPVVRAAVMALVLLLGVALDLTGDAANLLGVAGLGLLAHRPSSVGDVSFQLSFVATLAIILLVPSLAALTRPLPRAIGLLLSASLAAQIGVVPLLAVHFHRLAPAALVLNLVAVPLSSVVLLAGFAVVLFGAWAPALAWLAARAAEWSATLLLWSGEVVQAIPWVDVRVPTPGPGVLALYVAAALALAGAHRLRWTPVLLLAAAVVGIVLGTGPPPGDGRLWVSMLDVGEGDSLVLRSPAGRLFLVDAGGARPPAFDAGEEVTAPYLWSQGIRRVDGLLLTHGHSDHVGGAALLCRVFKPREVWQAEGFGQGEPIARALAASRAVSAVRVTGVGRGFRRAWDGVEIEVLWPPEVPLTGGTENDTSVVVRLRYRDVTFLLTGDIGASVEAQLAAGRTDVLKIPHHGSLSSSSLPFVIETSPRVAILSCGRRAERSRAVAEIVARYRRVGTAVYRTDRDGAITMATDGRGLWVSTDRDGIATRLAIVRPRP